MITIRASTSMAVAHPGGMGIRDVIMYRQSPPSAMTNSEHDEIHQRPA